MVAKWLKFEIYSYLKPAFLEIHVGLKSPIILLQALQVKNNFQQKKQQNISTAIRFFSYSIFCSWLQQQDHQRWIYSTVINLERFE